MLCRTGHRDNLCGVEFPVDLSHVNPGFAEKGSCDFFHYKDRVLYVCDYKNGTGKIVQAQDNAQLKGYAVGIFDQLSRGVDTRDSFPFPSVSDIEWIELVIVQPNGLDGEPIKTWRQPASVISEWRDELSFLAVPTTDEEAMTVCFPGEHCHWCNGATVCPKALTGLSQMMTLERAILHDGKSIAEWLNRVPMVKQIIKDLEDLALMTIQRGEDVPGWATKTTKRKNRAWTDTTGMIDRLRPYQQAGHFVIKETVRTPNQVEKELGKEQWKLVQQFVTEEPKEYTNLVKTDEKQNPNWD
jgi:hypothetical protein